MFFIQIKLLEYLADLALANWTEHVVQIWIVDTCMLEQPCTIVDHEVNTQ